jgi:hypothetical protein
MEHRGFDSLLAHILEGVRQAEDTASKAAAGSARRGFESPSFRLVFVEVLWASAPHARLLSEWPCRAWRFNSSHFRLLWKRTQVAKGTVC